MSRVLYLSQTGMTEPLGRSQVIPYLQGLARHGHEIELVAMEPTVADRECIHALAGELRAHGIRYHAERRSPSHAPFIKAIESARVLTTLTSVARRLRPAIVHARSYVPAMLGTALARIVPGAKLIFDCRGLVWDEYADYGWWPRSSRKYRLMKWVEPRLYRGAHAIVTLTERMRRWLVDEMRWVDATTPAVAIPCCVDLSRFFPDPKGRHEAREQLGAGERVVLGYAGSLGSWYCEDEMVRLFVELQRRRPTFFLILTRSDPRPITDALARHGVSQQNYAIRSVQPDDMPRMLSAADVAISFAQPALSKIASSPVKIAEYLALGVPVVMNRGVGDCDELFKTSRAAIDAGRLDQAGIATAVDQIEALLADPRHRDDARAAARAVYDLTQVGIARYAQLYQELAG